MSTEIAFRSDVGEAPGPRRYDTLDRVVMRIDGLLRAWSLQSVDSSENYPADGVPEQNLTPASRAESVAMMRVNHAGEVCAQALYHGQALLARDEQTFKHLLEAAREESEHLHWCGRRLGELDARTSRLDPIWYAGSFVTGTLAAAFGDETSLGFVVETERQVEAHLQSHLDALAPEDERSRAICRQMQADEARHGRDARDAGGRPLPAPVRFAMRLQAGIMTRLASRI